MREGEESREGFGGGEVHNTQPPISKLLLSDVEYEAYGEVTWSKYIK